MLCFNLSYYGGGGSKYPPFLFVKTIEKVIRLCTVLKKKSLSGSFEDRAIFHVSQLSYDGGGGLCASYRSIDKFVKKGENNNFAGLNMAGF